MQAILAREKISLALYRNFHYSNHTMPKITLEHIDRVEIERAIQKSGGIELLGALLGISGRQVRNYLSSEQAPKLAVEKIKQLGRT